MKALITALVILESSLFGNWDLTPAQIQDIAVDAYIYGYPLVTMEMSRQISDIPPGQFKHMRAFPTPDFIDIPAPNVDTLYSFAWLDLSETPYVLHLPDESNRYYLMPLLSGWTNVFKSLGTRTTGDHAGDYIITGPGYRGDIPPNHKEIKAPTNMVWIAGRTYCTGTPRDYKAVYALQADYRLSPLLPVSKPHTVLNSQTHTSASEQIAAMDTQTYFNLLTTLMVDNPPAKADAPMLAQMKKIGLEPGSEFKNSTLNNVPKLAMEKIKEYQERIPLVNGWVYPLHLGTYGTNYLGRALVAKVGLGANLPQDAIYPQAVLDNTGQPLTGQNNYLIHFDKAPPVKGFWSLTLYSNLYFLFPNTLNRYSLSSRDQLTYNSDGSLDIYIQSTTPGQSKESNWLPCPEGNFELIMRLYWPEAPLLNGTWKPPIIQKQ